MDNIENRKSADINTILFDLDGTLLPMDQDAFMEIYFRELSKRCLPLGYEPKALVDAVWKGTGAMVKKRRNHEKQGPVLEGFRLSHGGAGL